MPSLRLRAYLVLGVAVLSVQSLCLPSFGALLLPSADQVVERVLATARRVDLAAADVSILLRFAAPPTAPPECVFRGLLRMGPNRSALSMREWTARPVCWALARFVLGHLLQDRDRVDSLLPLFRFELLGERLVDGHLHYLVYGRARSPQAGVQWVIGWVDYDRGLVVDGTAHYPWGEVSSVQDYAEVRGVWVPVRQRLDVPRFHASLEILYSGFRFGENWPCTGASAERSLSGEGALPLAPPAVPAGGSRPPR